ncbi:protein WVD2-like 7 isoform X2 [Impatiens glandulifera]|uniref:protein WVD2-like 7 isoform X2 n=1 Tax=Impatiens glandulifera TaxID=253017 RepID=UPI001FB18266|nr:protein WVD2-like 7 isoform X2 [Impatiens glandulifera]
MAESTMEIKHSGPTLDVSVSFGRFQSDSLSWEKWSSFSPNKYLEEVEKCSTPGSVAQKKAYFEAHYKMIAARKASEQMELEKLTESDSQEVELDLKSSNEAIVEPLSTADLASDLASCSDFDHSIGKDVEVETYQISSSASSQENIHQSESLDHLEVSNFSLQEPSSLNGTMEESKEENHLNESKIKADQKMEMEKTQKTEKEKKTQETEMEKTQKTEKEKKTQETEMEKTQKTEMEKKTQETEMEKKKQKTAVNIKDDSKLDASKKSQKVRNSAEIKKKPTSPLIRSPQVFTQKIPKQLSTSMVASSSSPYQSSLSLRKSKTPATDNKRIPPSSLHMSMNLGHSNSNHPSSSSTRKSLIMEKMGDKDIVKRAFRTFQNSVNQLRSPADEKSTQRKQVSASSSSVTLRKENDSTRKTQPVKTDKTLRSQPGSKETKSSPMFVKAPAVDQRKAKPAPDRTEILKSGKKLEYKTANTKREGKTNIIPNPKVGEGKRGGVSEQKPKLNLNKANNRPNLYQAKSTSKKNSLLEMEGAKLEKHYQPEPRV